MTKKRDPLNARVPFFVRYGPTDRVQSPLRGYGSEGPVRPVFRGSGRGFRESRIERVQRVTWNVIFTAMLELGSCSHLSGTDCCIHSEKSRRSKSR